MQQSVQQIWKNLPLFTAELSNMAYVAISAFSVNYV